MNPEQLHKTRAERWRQNGSALVTLEDAEEWLEPLGLCLFLPRRVQLSMPAPSFVEACLGSSNATPPPAAIQKATALLTRLVDGGSVIPLNLLGISGEQPDFLVTREALPYVFALRGDKDWKHEPQTAGNGRVSPLVLGLWKALERTGVQTAIELREAMGKELTEAAVLRGLSELWNAMRVILLPAGGGEAATWELLKARYQKQMAAGSAMSQVSALSVLLAQYLESAVGATSEEAEIFLSPLSSRSKVRDVVRGLTATRQLAMIGLDGQAILYVEGTLPDFELPPSQVTIESVAAELPEAAATQAEGIPAGQKHHPLGQKHQRIRKFKEPVPRSPGEPDPLRWKRDSSVPPPPGQSRGPATPRPEAEGFDRRSRPARTGFARKPARPGATGPASASTGSPRRASGQEPPSRPYQRPAGGPGSRPEARAGAKPAAGFRKGAPGFKRQAGGFSGKGERSPTAGRSAPRGAPSFGKREGFGKREDFGKREGFRKDAFTPQHRAGKPGAPPSFARPAAGGFKPRANRPFPDRGGPSRAGSAGGDAGRPGSERQGPPRSSFRPRATGFADASNAPGTPRGEGKKPRWVPREAGRGGPPARGGGGRPMADKRSTSGRAFRPREDRAPAPGGARPFQQPGAGGFKPRPDRSAPRPPSSPQRPVSEDRSSSGTRPFAGRPAGGRTLGGSFSGRPASPRVAGPGGFQKKPRWVPREGSGTSRPGAGSAPPGGSPGGRPPRSFGGKPTFKRKPAFGERPGGSSRPGSRGAQTRGAQTGGDRNGEAGIAGKPALGAGRRSDSKAFGNQPPGSKRPDFKRPQSKRPQSKPRGPGDYPKRKRPQ